jgi:arginyl-tRNA synthetase
MKPKSLETIKKDILTLIKKEVKDDSLSFSIDILEKPPSYELGDFALPCFSLSKALKKNPKEIAKGIEQRIKSNLPSFLQDVKAVGPYINFFLDSSFLVENFLSQSHSSKNIKIEAVKNPLNIMVEYSSPNTNKPQHLGHIRNNLLGMSVSTLLEKVGHKVKKVNLLNDRGLGVSKVIYAYLHLSDKKKPDGKPDHFVGELYNLFNKEAKKNSGLEEEAQRILEKWEKGDKKIIDAWKKITDFVKQGYKETYERLGCSFDKQYWESQIYNEGKSIVMQGLEKGLFKKKDGAVIAELEPYGLPNKVLIKRNGTALYITQDIALAKKKFEDFDVDYSIYVVASEQELYFKQLFKIIELLDIAPVDKLCHLSYGMFLLEGGKMKSREGNIIDADSLIEELKKLALEEVDERYPGLNKKERNKRAERIAMAALKFYILRVDPNRDVVFKPKESISFQGETGPYLLYTYARLRSILRKSGIKPTMLDVKSISLISHEEEKQIASLGNEFSSIVMDSAQSFKPSTLCRFLLDFAQLINSYYHEKRVIGENERLMKARLSLLVACSNVLKEGLNLLGIEVLEEM